MAFLQLVVSAGVLCWAGERNACEIAAAPAGVPAVQPLPDSPTRMSAEEDLGLTAEEITAKQLYQAKHAQHTDQDKAGMENEAAESASPADAGDGEHKNSNANYENESSFASRTIMVWLLYLPLIFCFGMCYTEMGYGATTFKGAFWVCLFRRLPLPSAARPPRPQAAAAHPRRLLSCPPAGLSHQYDNSSKFVGSAFVVLFVSYTFDISEWHDGCWPILRTVIYTVAAGACGVGAMMSFQSVPYLPLALILGVIPLCARPHSRPAPALSTPLETRFPTRRRRAFSDPVTRAHSCAGFGGIRIMFFHECHIVHYIRSVGVVNVISGLFCLIASIIWCSHLNYWWGDDSKIRFKNALLVDDNPTYSACLTDCNRMWGLRPPSCNAGFQVPQERLSPGFMAEHNLDGNACHAAWESEACLSVRR